MEKSVAVFLRAKIKSPFPLYFLSILWGTTKSIESCRILFVRMSKLVSLRGRASSVHSDITSDTAINNVITREAIITCDFSRNVLEGIDRGEKYQRATYTFRRMRANYDFFNQQLSILGRNELRIFRDCLSGEKDMVDEEEIQYESAEQKVSHAKVKLAYALCRHYYDKGISS